MKKQPQAQETLIPPDGGFVYELTARVVLNRPWEMAVNAVGRPHSYAWMILALASLYPPTGKGEEMMRKYVMLYLSEDKHRWDRSLNWAKKNGLTRTTPREVFCIAEQCPELLKEIKEILRIPLLVPEQAEFESKSGTLVSTTLRKIHDGTPMTCVVRWQWMQETGLRREADRIHVDVCRGFFVFRR